MRDDVENHRRVMDDAAEQDEYVKNGVVVFDARPREKDNADRVSDAAGDR